MQKKFRIFLLVSSFFLLNNSLLASSNIDFIKSKIKSSALEYDDFISLIQLLHHNNGGVSGIVPIQGNFKIVNPSGGHFYVEGIHNGTIYDSSNGNGGVLKQKFSDCAFHAIDNWLLLDSFDGQLYYSNFSVRLRDDNNLRLFYIFTTFYAYLENKGNFNNFSDEFVTDKFIGNYFGPSVPSGSKGALPLDIIAKIAVEAGLTNPETKTRDGYMKMLKYVFTDMKNKMGLPGEFSFEDDAPHLLYVFKDGLGLSDTKIKNKLDIYKNNRKQQILKLTNYLNNFVKEYNIVGYNANIFGIFILFSPDKLRDLESISNLYVLQERSIQKNLSRFSRNENGSNFNLDYGNGKLFKNNRLGYDLSFSYINEYEFLRDMKFGLLFGYEQSTTSFDDCEMALKNVMIGGTFKKLYEYDRKSNFNTGVLLNVKINNNGNISKKDYNINFNNENVTLFLQDYRNININTPIISTIIISSTFNYTNYNIRNINIGSGLDNYNIINNIYHLFSLNFELDFIKTFKFSKTLKSNLIFSTRVLNYLNKPSNGFKLVNKNDDSIYFMSNSVMEARNNIWFNFKADIQIGKYVEISGIIGTNVMLKKDTFIGASLMVKF